MGARRNDYRKNFANAALASISPILVVRTRTRPTSQTPQKSLELDLQHVLAGTHIVGQLAR
jgi:hypothetical protein